MSPKRCQIQVRGRQRVEKVPLNFWQGFLLALNSKQCIGLDARLNRGIQSATEMLPLLRRGGVLHIVLTAPPRLSICVLLTHLFLFYFSFSRRPAMLGLMGFSGSLPLSVTIIDIICMFMFINWANKDACLLLFQLHRQLTQSFSLIPEVAYSSSP